MSAINPWANLCTSLGFLFHILKMTNKVKGLDLIECLKNYGRRFTTFYRRQ